MIADQCAVLSASVNTTVLSCSICQLRKHEKDMHLLASSICRNQKLANIGCNLYGFIFPVSDSPTWAKQNAVIITILIDELWHEM